MCRTCKGFYGVVFFAFLQLMAFGKLYADDPNDARVIYLGKALLEYNYKTETQGYNVYNEDKKGWHPGIDYKAKVGTPVYSPVDGNVYDFDLSDKAPDKGLGRLSIRIENSNDYLILLHLSGINTQIKRGVPVKKGDLIAFSGDKGGVPPHLHVELRTGRYIAAEYFRNNAQTGVNKNPAELILLRVADSPAMNNRSGADHAADRLLGKWSGSFRYDDYRRRGVDGRFVLNFDRDSNNMMKGIAEEPWSAGAPAGVQKMISDIEQLSVKDNGNGDIAISFVKRYRYDGHTVAYTGVLRSDNSMEGQWSIGSYKGTWSAVR
jgi:hypothetical protein